MKNYVLLMSSIITVCSSCRECVTCSNKCYNCGSASNTCSTDFVDKASWNNMENMMINGGCEEVMPTDKIEVCDNDVNNIVFLYERENYYCK